MKAKRTASKKQTKAAGGKRARLSKRAAKRTSRQWVSFIEQAPLSIAMFDREMNYLAASRRWVAEYGRGYTDLIGRNHYDVHPDLPERWKEVHRKGLAGESLKNDDDLWVQDDGTKIWLRWSVTPWMDDDGNVGGIIISTENITERKQAEEAILLSEKRLRALIENSSEEVSLLAADGSLLYESPSSNPTLGYAPGEFLGQNLFQLVHPDDLARVQSLFFDLVQKPGASVRDQFRLRHRSGEWRWVEAVGTNLLEEPAVQAVVVNYHDISERKRAEDALQQSERRYRALFEDSPVAIWEEDFSQVKIFFDQLRANGVTDFHEYFQNHPEAVMECVRRVMVLDVNRAGLEMIHAHDKSQLLGPLTRSLHKDALPTVIAELISLAEGNLSYEGDEVFTRSQSEGKRHVFFRLTVAPGYEETLGKVFVSIVDITERKQAEEALRQSEERFQNIIQHSSSMFYTHTPDHVLTYVSPQCREILDCEPEEAKVHWHDFLSDHPQNRQGVEATERAIRTGERQPPYELELITRKGRRIWVQADESPLVRDGETIAIVGSLTDITARKNAERALQESERRYRAVFENTPVAIWEEDFSEVKRRLDALKREGIRDLEAYFNSHPAALRECMDLIRVLDVNETALRMYEAADKASLIHSAMEEPGVGEFAHNARDFALIAQGVTHGEWEGEDTTLSGRPIVIHLTWSVAPGHEADFSRVIVTTVDITERKQAETDLINSYSLLNATLESTADGILVVDASGKVTSFNSKFLELWRIPKELADQRDDQALIAYVMEQLEDPASFITKVQELYRSPAQTSLDELRFRDGRIFERYSQAQVLGDKIVGRVWSFRDVTERRQAQDALQKSEQRYRVLFEDSPVSIWEEDFSQLKKRLDSLKAQGIADLKTYFASHPGAIEEYSSLIRILDVNKAALRMYGAESKEQLIASSVEALSKGERENIINDFIAVAEGRTSNYWEGADETLTGEPIEISLGWSVLPGHESDYSKVIVTVIDITERKKAERELLASEERFRLLAGNIREVFWITDPIAQKDVYLSPAYEEIWGRKPEEQLRNKETFIESVLPEDRQKALENIDKQIRGEGTEMEYRIRRPDGSIRWIWDRAFPIFDESKKVKLITGIAADITERKRAEAETLRHVDELRALYENGLAVGRLLSPREIGEKMIQTFTRYLSWHHVTIRLRKGESDDLELVAFNVPHLEEAKKDVEQNFTARINKVGQGMSGWVVQTGVPVRTGNVHEYPQYVDTYEGIRSGMYMPLIVGERIIGSISVESEEEDAFTYHDERLLATLAAQAAVAFENARLYQTVRQELSERRRAEEMLEQERNSLARRVEERTTELIAANKNLARALRVKDEFLANMSHELRTPLNAILGLSESLAEQVAGPLNEKQQKYVQTITESGHHLLALINDILDLAKIEAGQVTLDISKVNVHALCQSCLRMIKQMAQKKNQEVSLEIDHNFGLIWADERRLKQMIVNLLSNAVKFTPEGGKLGLEVHGDKEENRVLITVWDHGIGIADDDISKLFQPFVQLSTGLARESSGTGLGLALVAQMARLHGGGVSVSSVPGEGSRFTLVLPWEPALAVDTLERMKVTGKFRAVRKLDEHERRTILLIEDTPEVVMMVRDYLEMAGYNVATAEDGLEGLAQAKRVRPDLILMDLQMPRMDGFETTRKLREDPDFKTTPIIALTALAMQGDRERCLAAGMDEYITKPVNLKALVKIIEACLTQPDKKQHVVG